MHGALQQSGEEIVRQRFIRHLCDHYGYTLDQMAQERRTTHGHRSPRADVVIWESPKAKAANRTPVLVVECKAENVDIDIRDYYQGESYTRAAGDDEEREQSLVALGDCRGGGRHRTHGGSGLIRGPTLGAMLAGTGRRQARTPVRAPFGGRGVRRCARSASVP